MQGEESYLTAVSDEVALKGELEEGDVATLPVKSQPLSKEGRNGCNLLAEGDGGADQLAPGYLSVNLEYST